MSTKYVSSIELIFENFEDIEVPRKYIGSFLISKINTTIMRTASNCIEKQTWSDEAFFQIAGEPYDDSYVFGKKEKEKYYPFDFSGHQPTFARILAYDDITGIIVKYKDGTEELYTIPYSCWSGSNEWQQARVGKDGSLYVLIGKSLKMEDYVSPDKLIDMQKQRALWESL